MRHVNGKQLRQSDIDIEALLNSFHGDIVITNGEGIILNISATCEQLYGMPRADFIGKHVEELERMGIFNPSVTKRVLREKTRISMIQVTPTNTRVLVTAVPVYDDDGQIIRVVSYTHDLAEMTEIQHLVGELQQEMKRMNGELQLLRNRELAEEQGIVSGNAMQDVISMIDRVAQHDVTILLTGESGVGKSLYAKHIHNMSRRAKGPFIEVNCGAIPEALFESELFGYEPGAFTGASKNGKLGLFELSHHGTILLDEIGELPMSIQVKLLKVIQERQFMRVGGTKPVSSNFRLIAATNRNLETMVKEGRFRADLYFRLNVVPIHIPPLRDRREDIPQFVERMMKRFNAKYGLNTRVSPLALKCLMDYSWPGNIRELEHLIERLVVTVRGSVIEEGHLPPEFHSSHSHSRMFKATNGSLPELLAQIEYQILLEARQAGKSTNEMAREFGISQPTVVRKLQKYGIE
jgi:transcriptional regulator with PAS, ATPase and Fis domain